MYVLQEIKLSNEDQIFPPAKYRRVVKIDYPNQIHHADTFIERVLENSIGADCGTNTTFETLARTFKALVIAFRFVNAPYKFSKFMANL